MENNLYFYLSKLILEYFLKGIVQSGDRFQIYFEKQENVIGLYNCLKIFTEKFYPGEIGVGEFKLNNYTTYNLQFNNKKLIIAYHENGDLLTGLRNNFDKVEGHTADTGILFIHNTELESITKGAESLSNKSMPLHIDSVRENIIATFSEEEDNRFSKSQKEFLRQLLSLDSFDYQIESTSLFDLKKYLDILNKKELEKSDYNALGVFFDDQVHNHSVAKAQIKTRLVKNSKWFAEISRNEQLGTLRDYLEKSFDKEGQNKLIKSENWPEISFEDLLKYEENRGNIKFNEYLPITSEITEDGNVIWDKADGGSKARKQNRNILVFNPLGVKKIVIRIAFKRRPSLKFLSHGNAEAALLESENTFEITFDNIRGFDFNHFLISYTEVKEEKKNYLNFKVLILPFDHTLFLGVKALYRVQRQKMGLEFHSDSDITFNDQGVPADPIAFEPSRRYAIDDERQLRLDLSDLNITDSTEFPFTMAYRNATMFAQININAIKPQLLTGWNLWRRKVSTGKSVFYSKKIDDKSFKTIVTLEHGNQIFFPTGDFRENLLLEEQLIESGYPIHTILESGELHGEETDVPTEIKEIYNRIIKYFRDTHKGKFQLLPSTTYIDNELKILYTEYVQVYFHLINKIRHNDVLSNEFLALLNLATVKEESGLNQWKFTPFHPLIIAYQLKLMEKVQDENLPNKILSKFTAVNLLPFINNGINHKDYFIAVDQEHSPEWMYYVNAQLEGQSINRKNAPEIISSKIHEFIKHFSFLYIDHESPIRLNLVNVGNGKEALQGIFEYIIIAIKKLVVAGKNPLEVHPVLLNIYGSGNYVTKFEQFSKFDNIKEILKEFEIDLTAIKDIIDPEDLLRLYHERVQFFIKDEVLNDPDEYEYAHITFHQFNEQDVEKSDNNTLEVSTGISLDGILSDLPSIFNHGNYRTGFGLRSLPEEMPNVLISISKKLNAIAHVSGTSNIFKDDFAFASVINNNVRSKLTKVYDSSQWITFINPMVDLSFFKNDEEVVIIHYTDHYGNSSGYDSITITTKWKQYEFILKEYLSGKVDHAGDFIKPIINMFNAINGYWLLKLGSQNVNEIIEKEKISILSAVKEMLAILDHPKITWVVLSLEEILRVTGSAGLAQNDGLFTIKNLDKSGAFSDDLLMVGLETVNDELRLYFYPVEVKIGNNVSGTIKKGIGQGSNTYNLLMETLNQKGLTGAIYRNYFAKLILTASQKLSLYNVWPAYADKWDKIELLRGKLLNDMFSIGSLTDFVGHFAVMSFKNNEFKNRSISYVNKDEPYLMISLYQSDGLNDLVQTVDSLKGRYMDATAIGITHEDLLSFTYELDPAAIMERNSNGMIEDEGDPEDVENLGDADFGDDANNEESGQGNGFVLPVEPETQTVVIELSPERNDPLKILFGTKASDHKPVEWFPTSTDKVMHTNTGIIGTMGTGKTQFTKSLITQLYQNTNDNVDGKKIGVLIFDYKGDYIKDDFVSATDANVYQLHHLPYNPLALFLDKTPKKLLPLHTASTLQDTISKAFSLGNKQRALLKDLIMSAYSDAGIYRADEASWSNTAPTIADVCEIYLNDDNSSIDSLHAVLKELYDFEIFEPHGNKAVGLFDLLDGVTVINLSGYNSEIQNLVVAITLDLFYSQMQNQGHSKIDGNFRQINKMILVDEADNFLSKNFESLRKILKEGREYGVGTILSTQFLNHFATSDNEYSNYILTWIIHRVNEIKEKEVGSLFDLPNKADRDDLIGVIKSLEKHYSIVNLAGSKPIKIKDKAFWELLS